MITYHVQTIDAFLQGNPCREAIVDSRTSNELVWIGQHCPQLLDCGHCDCVVGDRAHLGSFAVYFLWIFASKRWGCRSTQHDKEGMTFDQEVPSKLKRDPG